MPGVIEAPFLVSANRVESHPISTVDMLPTLLDLLGRPTDRNSIGWPIDGVSLVPILRAGGGVRSAPLGWHSDFQWVINYNNSEVVTCSMRNTHAPPPSFPANFSTPFNQAQFAWSEGHIKLFACRSETPDATWRFSLYDVVADQAEAHDLWPSLGDTVGDAMFQRFAAWQASVVASIESEGRCAHTHE